MRWGIGCVGLVMVLSVNGYAAEEVDPKEAFITEYVNRVDDTAPQQNQPLLLNTDMPIVPQELDAVSDTVALPKDIGTETAEAVAATAAPETQTLPAAAEIIEQNIQSVETPERTFEERIAQLEERVTQLEQQRVTRHDWQPTNRVTKLVFAFRKAVGEQWFIALLTAVVLSLLGFMMYLIARCTRSSVISIANYPKPNADDVKVTVDSGSFDGNLGGNSARLNLARAYIEMEHFDKAREVLQEVLKQGNEREQQEAKKLLEKIG